MGCLYMLTFPNGKRYIGITVLTAEERFRNHVSHIGSRQYAVTRALKKYGPQSVKVETLGWGDWGYLQMLERQSIAAFGTRAPHGYNMTDGGDGALGYVHDEAAKEKMRAWQVGRKLTEEHKQKVALAMTGRVFSEETKAKLRGHGPKRTAEARSKMSAANKGRKRSPETCARIAQARAATNSSGVSGVFWHKVAGKWCAQMKVTGGKRRLKYLGIFEDWFDAVAARKSAENRSL